MADRDVDAFVRQMLDELGAEGKLGKLSRDLREQLVADLGERLLDQIDRALIEALPPHRLAQFNTLLDNDPSDEHVQNFIAASGVDPSGVAQRSMLLFAESYLGRHGDLGSDKGGRTEKAESNEVDSEATSIGNSPPGLAGRWLKTVSGRRFIVELHEDNTLTEALQDAPNDAWSGKWSLGRTSETNLEDSNLSIGFEIAGYLTTLRQLDDGHLEGIERECSSNPSMKLPSDGQQGRVELFRI